MNAGDVVRVTGFARERFNQTTINGSNSNTRRAASEHRQLRHRHRRVRPTSRCRSPPPTFPERYEGMLVRFPQSLVIAEYFNYDRFGEIVLALPLDGEPRPFTGTAIDEPGAAANRAHPRQQPAADHARRRAERAEPAVPPASERRPVHRSTTGSAAATRSQNAVGVLGFDFSLYRIYPDRPGRLHARSTRARPRRSPSAARCTSRR